MFFQKVREKLLVPQYIYFDQLLSFWMTFSSTVFIFDTNIIKLDSKDLEKIHRLSMVLS